MPCELTFWPNVNYVDDDEHDENPWKHWYLAPEAGLFTKKTDADVYGDPDDQTIHFTRRAAHRAWDAYRREHHDHSAGPAGSTRRNARSSSPTHARPPSGISRANSTCQPAVPCVGSAKPSVRQEASVKRDTSVKPEGSMKPLVVKREGAGSVMVKAERAGGVKRERPDVKREAVKPEPVSPTKLPCNIRPAPVSEKKIPLWADETEKDSNDVPTAPVARRQVFPTLAAGRKRVAPAVVLSDVEEDKGDVSMPLAPPMSPSISSASSLSSSGLSSISGLRRIFRAPLGFKPLPGSSAPAVRASLLLGRLLYNCNTQRLYKDAATAVQEMGLKDVIEVVAAEEVVEFCSVRVVAVEE
ncbi:hypothetical protein C8R45DRAFT_936015 [Mycena sanguinolenta]|nr:hypothetical protein C8R45DRAFT_936015 [Mycena sanguinolenta]